jgi:hypothetical protein
MKSFQFPRQIFSLVFSVLGTRIILAAPLYNLERWMHNPWAITGLMTNGYHYEIISSLVLMHVKFAINNQNE